jgi:hypothetical protein
MKQETLTALKMSIEHWEDIVKDPENTPSGRGTCALCQEFNPYEVGFNPLVPPCEGCPVKEKTGKSYCNNTPYSEFQMNRTSAEAQKELDFLKSLLPPIDWDKPVQTRDGKKVRVLATDDESADYPNKPVLVGIWSEKRDGYVLVRRALDGLAAPKSGNEMSSDLINGPEVTEDCITSFTTVEHKIPTVPTLKEWMDNLPVGTAQTMPWINIVSEYLEKYMAKAYSGSFVADKQEKGLNEPAYFID